MTHSHDPVARRLRRPAILVGLCLSLGAAACAEQDPTSPASPEEADRPSISLTRPAPAAGAHAGTNSEGGILVTWMDASSNEQGFRILRSIDGGSFEEVGVGGADTRTYGDYTVQPGQSYRYAVAAFNAAGEADHAVTDPVRLD